MENFKVSSINNDDFLDTTEWKPIHLIPGYESCIEYFISRHGEVLSHKGVKPRLLKQTLGMDGYYLVTLTQRLGRKKSKCVAVHKLVAFAFLSPPPLPYGNTRGCCNIDHIDEDKTNNKASNLCWITPADNNRKQKKYAKNNTGNTINVNPTRQQLRHREVALKSIHKKRQDPKRLEEIRNYKKEWMRKKRAEQKAAKIDKDSPEISSNG